MESTVLITPHGPRVAFYLTPVEAAAILTDLDRSELTSTLTTQELAADLEAFVQRG